MGLTLITVTGKYTLEDGVTAAAGTVIFELSNPLQDTAGNIIAAPVPKFVTLDNTGAFSISLAATDDSTTTPGGVTYRVTEVISGGAPQRTYAITLPHTAAGGTVNLADLAPVDSAVAYRLASLSDLKDVSTSGANDGDYLGYNAATATWSAHAFGTWETPTGAQTKANAAAAAAEAYSDNALSQHTTAADPHPQYATDTDLSAGLALKANASDVATSLAAKADASALTTKADLVAGKVPTSELPATMPPSTHTHAESDVTNLTSDLASKIAASTATTKGDLLAATAASAITRLGVGPDGYVLSADSTQATGLKWIVAPSGSGGASATDIQNLYDAIATETNRAIDAEATKASATHSHAESDVTNLTSDLAGKVSASTFTTKGDVLVGTGAGAFVRLGAGTDGFVLTADSTQTSGLKWAAGGGGTVADATTTSKGIVQLAGDLAGTAASPTVPGLSGKEPTISAGTATQYWRGDKSWQTLNAAAVSGAEATANKDTNSGYVGRDASGLATVVGLKADGTFSTGTNASRYLGDRSAVPSAGAHVLGDWYSDRTNQRIYYCTTAGTPGTFTTGPYLASTAPVALGTASNGSGQEAARANHVHPTTGLVTTVNGASGAITNVEVNTNKGAASGYAPLNASSVVPIANLPTGTTSTTLATGEKAVPAGGSALAVLIKSSASDYAVQWTTGATVPGQVFYNSGLGPTWGNPFDFDGPKLNEMLAWNADFAATNSSAASMSGGKAYFLKVLVPYTMTVTNIITTITTAGATLTANQCLAAIYDSSGNRLGVTADQSTAWATAGVQTMAISGGAISVAGGPGVFVWVALLAVGTTPPQLARTPAAALGNVNHINAGCGTSNLRVGSIASQTALGATVTPTSMGKDSAQFLVGLS